MRDQKKIFDTPRERQSTVGRFFDLLPRPLFFPCPPSLRPSASRSFPLFIILLYSPTEAGGGKESEGDKRRVLSVQACVYLHLFTTEKNNIRKQRGKKERKKKEQEEKKKEKKKTSQNLNLRSYDTILNLR